MVCYGKWDLCSNLWKTKHELDTTTSSIWRYLGHGCNEYWLKRTWLYLQGLIHDKNFSLYSENMPLKEYSVGQIWSFYIKCREFLTDIQCILYIYTCKIIHHITIFLCWVKHNGLASRGSDFKRIRFNI